MPILQVVRTPTAGAWGADHFPGFGTVLRSVKDPDGIDITKEQTEAIRLSPDFVKVPAAQCNRISNLYVEMLCRGAGQGQYQADSQKEVSVVVLRDEATLTKWRVLVPTQVVGGASVSADYEQPLCDIETGEEIKVFPPPGWCVAGTSHSHNTMQAFFSSVDDRNELPQPGVHFVLGNFKKTESGGHQFDVAPSIVYFGKRYEKIIGEDGKPRQMLWTDITDFTVNTDELAHKNVYDYVKTEAPKNWDHEGFAKLNAGAGTMLYSTGPSQYAADIDRARDFSYHRDWEEMWRRQRKGKTDGKPMDKFATNLDGIVGPLTHQAFVEWCDDFDTQIQSGVVDLMDDLDASPRTPVLVMADGDTIYTIPDHAKGTRMWCITQKHDGACVLDIDIAVVRLQNDGPAYYVSAGINKPGEFRRYELREYGDLKAIAKRQRRAWKKSAGYADKDTNGGIRFFTRGVSSEEFTQSEMEQMVEAWCSNLKQRSDFRIAVSKHLKFKEG